MRRAYIPYATVVWPVREGRETLTDDSISDPCDEGARSAMVIPRSNDVAGHTPPLMAEDASLADGDDRSAQANEQAVASGVLTTSFRLAAVPSTVVAARSFTADSLTLWQVPSEAAEDVVLIVSELVTNAVRAGGINVLEPDNSVLASAPIVGMRLTLAGGSLLVEVWDSSASVPELRQQYEETEGGRGLFLVSMLAERWSYYPSEQGGKVVWAELAVYKAPNDGSESGNDADSLPGAAQQSSVVVSAHTGSGADVAMLERVLWGLQRLATC